MGFGSIAGPLAGGFLVDFLGWRSLFLFSVLAGIIIVALGVIILDPNRFAQDNQRGHGRKFDWPGSVLCGGTILILLLAITNGHRIGWASTPMIGATVLFSALLGTFIWWELRTPSPMLDLSGNSPAVGGGHPLAKTASFKSGLPRSN